jgi:hypothetical protein
MKQQFLKSKTDTIRCSVYQNNRPIVPTAAYVTLYSPGSDEELQAKASASIDGTTGEMTYSLTAAHTADNDINYKALWEYTYNGIDYQEIQLFDVVKSILSIPLIDDDIYVEQESLRKRNTQETGTVTAATSSTFTDTAKRKEDDDYWRGGTVEIVHGTGNGQRRDVTSFAKSTSSFAIAPNWTTNPDTTSKYVVVKSYTNKIQSCFEKIETMLYNKGKRHELILEASQIKYPLLYLTIHTICLDAMDEVDDKWSRLAEQYWNKFQNEFNNLRLEYDEDESGGVSGEEEQHKATELRIGRA